MQQLSLSDVLSDHNAAVPFTTTAFARFTFPVSKVHTVGLLLGYQQNNCKISVVKIPLAHHVAV